MAIENNEGVHSEERPQSKKKTKGEQYSDHHDLNNHPYVESDEVEDVDERGRVRILQE